MLAANLLNGLSEEVIAKGVGSTEYQVASLTSRIENVKNHNKENKKDYSAKYGLIKMVSKRNRLLKYLSKNNNERYKALIGLLGLRK